MKTLPGKQPDWRVLIVLMPDGLFTFHLEIYSLPSDDTSSDVAGWRRRVILAGAYASVDLAEEEARKRYSWLAP